MYLLEVVSSRKIATRQHLLGHAANLCFFETRNTSTRTLDNYTPENCKHSDCSPSSFFSYEALLRLISARYVDVKFYEQQTVDNWEDGARETQSEPEQVFTR